jgi:hypothetical protein
MVSLLRRSHRVSPVAPRILAALIVALGLVLATGSARADPAKFDLAGPGLRVSVTRAGSTLPIGRVPSLAAGDQIALHADLPPGQSAHFLLAAAFLRGATNPPPKSWFFLAETWKPGAREGLKIVVPVGAQQLLVFLAPDRSGGFKTLMGAVRGRPGAFVRASQDLVQTGLDRSRLKAFLAAVGRAGASDPERLKSVSALLARSLVIKLNADCFQKVSELQAACLAEGGDSLVLNDGHGASIVETLTSGNPAELVQQLSATPQAHAGYYSPYVGAVLDIARILDGLRTAHYQYVPAVADADGDHLGLILNTAPSFHDPVSVLVAALPPVAPARPPTLAPVDPKAVLCLQAPGLVLPVDGAPLVFSTAYLHNVALRLPVAGGETIDLPAIADPERGGFVIDVARLGPADAGATVQGALHGIWGFSPYEGPIFALRGAGGASAWRLSDDDKASLIVGRDDVVRLLGDGAPCVESVTLRLATGETVKAGWKVDSAGTLIVTAPLGKARPGPLALLVKSWGRPEADVTPLRAFNQTGHFDTFLFHLGDRSGVLKGSRLDEVASLTLAGETFTPGALVSTGGADELTLDTLAEIAVQIGGEVPVARVALKDGRVIRLPVTLAPRRPGVELIARGVTSDAEKVSLHVALTGRDELPWDGRLTFSIRVQAPATLSARDQLEITAPAAAVSVILGSYSGLILEDTQVAVATLDPAAAFGPSAFGPLRFRLLHDGAASDWRPLGVLVRRPALRRLDCPTAGDKPCELSGADLFLLDSVSRDAGFEHPVTIPEGFPGTSLAVPRPAGNRLYARLRDDPTVISEIVIGSVKP